MIGNLDDAITPDCDPTLVNRRTIAQQIVQPIILLEIDGVVFRRLTPQLYSRIDEAICHIGQDVHDDDEEGVDHQYPLQHRVVALAKRADDQLAEPGAIKTISVRTELPIRMPKNRPTTVMIGISAARGATPRPATARPSPAPS